TASMCGVPFDPWPRASTWSGHRIRGEIGSAALGGRDGRARPSADNPGWSRRPRGWPEPLSVRRIVACVDGSGPSEQVLPLAAAWARALGMSMTILTVIEDTLPPLRPERQKGRYESHPDAESYVDAL